MPTIEWLLRNTPRETDPAPAIKTTRPAMPISAGDDDTMAGQANRRYILEPYFVMIEYRDATGVLTQRRITMRHVDERGPTRYLCAICHERNALRTFRLDRISCFITQDGEVEDAAAWFAETLPISDVQNLERIKRPASVAKPAAAVSPYTALRREITPGIVFLIAAARSDDILHPRELDRILRYAEDEAFGLRDAGALPGPVEADAFSKLERTITRLRPTRVDVEAAAAELAKWSADRKLRLAHALAETVVADGRVDQIEAEIVDELRLIGDRDHGFGWSG